MNRILIVGSGDIAMRVMRLLPKHCQVMALLRNPARAQAWRQAGAVPILADLDERRSLRRLAGMADTVLHFAPPAPRGRQDSRTRNLLAALASGSLPARLLYLSTSGVYGACAGERVAETRTPHPANERAWRRLDAERQLRRWGVRNHVQIGILRVPGIYAAERLPLERLRQGLPVIVAEQDGYSNHIHADDLAHLVLAALRHGAANRIYHVSDDSELKMGDYFDLVADACGLPRPPRMLREEVMRQVTPQLWSFMSESRRLSNRRMKQELHYRLRYPTVHSMLSSRTRAICPADGG